MQRAGELHTCCIAEAKRVLWACIQALRFCPPVRETDTRTDTHTQTHRQTDRATSVLRRHTFALGARNAAT